MGWKADHKADENSMLGGRWYARIKCGNKTFY